jgi:hypothetical protein
LNESREKVDAQLISENTTYLASQNSISSSTLRLKQLVEILTCRYASPQGVEVSAS